MSDTFSVTAAWGGPYTTGQTITATLSGGATATTSGTAGPLTIPVVAADGTPSTISVPAVPITVVTPQSVVIDTTRAIVDTSPTPRTWTVSANKLSITATA